MSDPSPTAPTDRLRQLYGAVDARVAELTALHQERLNCKRGCSGCCLDGLTVFEVEAEHIAQTHGALLKEGAPHPEGACAFLDAEGGCRVYESRPYVCRTHGLPLRWEDETEEGEWAEFKDICPLNAEGPALETLPPEACLTLGPFEGQLAQMQAERDGWTLRRVALRDLFKAGG